MLPVIWGFGGHFELTTGWSGFLLQRLKLGTINKVLSRSKDPVEDKIQTFPSSNVGSFGRHQILAKRYINLYILVILVMARFSSRDYFPWGLATGHPFLLCAVVCPSFNSTFDRHLVTCLQPRPESWQTIRQCLSFYQSVIGHATPFG